jgi:hypothetical protein
MKVIPRLHKIEVVNDDDRHFALTLRVLFHNKKYIQKCASVDISTDCKMRGVVKALRNLAKAINKETK